MRSVLYIFLILTSMICWGCKGPIEGCMDPNSSSYNPDAEESNGTCVYPAQTKKIVCFFFTDSDNNTCGTFGINLLDQVKATNQPYTFFISIHPNGTDAMFTPTGIDISSAFQVAGFPDFGVGDQSGLLNQSSIINAIDMEAVESAQGGIDVDYSITADSIVTIIYGKFYANDTSAYFASAYVIEDNVVSPQVGISPTYSHQHVFRASSGPSGIGEEVNTQPISSSTSFKIHNSIYRDPTWNIANISVIAVLWRKNGADFEYINAGN